MKFALNVRALPQPKILDQVRACRAENAREFTQLLADFERLHRVQRMSSLPASQPPGWEKSELEEVMRGGAMEPNNQEKRL